MSVQVALSFLIIFLLITFGSCQTQQLLDGVPVIFKLKGAVTYTPSSGGVPIPGYSIQVGYTKNQWIGVRFMELTSFGNTDVLIFQRSTSPQSGNYKCTVSQHYSSSVRPNVLLADTVNRMDRFVDSYSDSNLFDLQIYRTIGITNGQDWQAIGSQFLRVCFFTSNITFDLGTWTNQHQSCYGYDVNNFVSTLKGKQISNFTLEGVQSFLYGGFTGPSLKILSYVYRPSGNALSNPNLMIKMGERVSSTVGFDYHKCGDGDYYGESYSSASKDLIVSGYDDGSCSVVQSATSTRIYFERAANTADQFDFQITKNQFDLCFYTAEETCKKVTLEYLFPVMSIQSAIRLFGTAHMLPLFLMIGVVLTWFF